MQSKRWDVVVVGGSFAGLACAHTAAARGLRTLCLERKADPGASVRTTGILVKELLEQFDVPARFTRPITGVRLYSPRDRWIDLESPGYFFAATDTAGLLRWLAARSRAVGAQCRFGAGVDRIVRQGDGWSLQTRAGPIATRWLVGADGPRSSVAAACGLGRNRAFLCGAEATVADVGNVDPARLHCFVDRTLAPGYIGWAVPGPLGAQIGLACRQPTRPDLRAMLARTTRVFDWSRARVLHRRGGLIPVGGPVRPVAAPGVCLVGDAAGQVSPLTAGGIHKAWRHGRRVATAIADHLLAGGPAADRVVATEQPRYPAKRWLRRLADWGPPDWVFEAVLATRPLRALASTIFFHHRGLRSARAWRAVLRSLLTGRSPCGSGMPPRGT